MAAAAIFVADFLGAEHDTPPEQRVARPERSFVVCSTPRSGSGLLGRGLAAAGVATPLEYFNTVHRGILTRRWGCGADLDSYLEALHQRRTTGSGLFGAKLHWAQMADVRGETGAGPSDPSVCETPGALIDRLFPSPVFVRTTRADLDMQAVSYWRALSSDIWSVATGDGGTAGSDAAEYDYEGIERCRSLIEHGERCWERLVEYRGADSIVVRYEELDAAYAETVARVAASVAPGAAADVGPPSTRRMRDERSLELVERFRGERRRRG